LIALLKSGKMDRLLTPTMLAETTGLAKQTIYNRLSSGGDLPPTIRLGKRALRWRESDVDAWIANKVSMPVVVLPTITNIIRKRGRPTKKEQIARR
jgi:predicted DNA-binding transcriptional regulator AlpA